MRILTSALLSFCILSASLGLRAEEGMWMPDAVGKLPLAKMKAKGFQLKPEDVFSTTAPSLKDAIVIIDGGTGEFVSPEGLLLTNHHVAFEGVAAVSTPEKDHLTNGYTAKNRSEEIPMPGYTCNVLREMTDVTAQVLAGAKDDMSAEERQKTIAAKQKEIIDEAKKNNPGAQVQVKEMLSGLGFELYVYDVYRDVRLVYVPSRAVGVYGGDDDNFRWPRHTGDFTFVRVYCAPNGKPADYAAENVPYKPKKYLTISTNGYKEGDFVMIMGYPGTTTRYREASSLAVSVEVQLPAVVKFYTAQIELLRDMSRGDKKFELEYTSNVQGLANTKINFEGTLKGLRRARLLERRRAEEAEFMKYVESKPEWKAKYGEVISKLDKLNAERRSTLVPDFLMTALVGTKSPVVGLAMTAINRAIEADKPQSEQTNNFPPPLVEQLKKQVPAIFQARNAELERRYLELVFRTAAELPDDQKSPIIEKLFAGKNEETRIVGEKAFIRQMLESPYLGSAQSVQVLFDMSFAQLKAQNNPGLNFLIEAAQAASDSVQRTEKLTARLNKFRALYIEGMTAFQKKTVYPDANRTLRFTYGEVKGYKPFDGAKYDYITSLSGMLEKDTGVYPFNMPDNLKELLAKRDFGTYADPKLNDVPVAFLATTDITGGNSGSPIMNGKGEMLGLAFDGNYEGLGSDYAFNPELARTISVDIRYVLFLAEKSDGAGYLFKELTFAGKAAKAGR